MSTNEHEPNLRQYHSFMFRTMAELELNEDEKFVHWIRNV